MKAQTIQSQTSEQFLPVIYSVPVTLTPNSSVNKLHSETCKSSRTRQIITSVVNHLHAIVRETKPSNEEWEEAIDFITRAGKESKDKMNVVFLLGAVLGLNTLINDINHPKPLVSLTLYLHDRVTEDCIKGVYQRHRVRAILPSRCSGISFGFHNYQSRYQGRTDVFLRDRQEHERRWHPRCKGRYRKHFCCRISTPLKSYTF